MSDELPELAALAASSSPLPAMSPALQAELAGLAPVALRRPLLQLAVLGGASLLYAIAVLAALHIRLDVDELPMPWLVGASCAWLLGFAIPMYLGIVPAAGRVVPSAPRALTAAVIAAIGFVALGLALHPSGATSLDYGWPRFARGHTCMELGLLTAVVPIALGAWFVRRAMPVGSRWIAAAIGASGGCLGGLVLHMHCHVADAQHVGLVHGGVVVVAALLAAAIVPRATKC